MTIKLIQLVTHQPVFNLMSIRAIKPDEVLFVGTPEEHATIEHLQRTIKREMAVHTLDVHDQFDPIKIHQDIAASINKLGWDPHKVIYDLSGGNKVMAFGAFTLARRSTAVFTDIERVGKRYRLRVYHFEDDHAMLKQDSVLPSLFSLEDYLNAHLPGFHVDGFSTDERGRIDEGGEFEQAIFRALEPSVDEILAGLRPGGVAEQVEIDLVVRKGNSVGLIEAKTGVKKAGIDQLNTAGNPIFMGMYATKFLVTGRRLPRAHRILATAQDIHVIELPSYYPGQGIRHDELRNLHQRIHQVL